MSTTNSEAVSTAVARSGRPAKRAKATNAIAKQGSEVDALFANPDRALEKIVGPRPKTVAAPPEIVTNVQGSSAGAGSGEFHVYKASRRREYERLRAMDEEVEREKADEEWEQKRHEAKSKEEAKLSKNRARREKQKARQEKAKGRASAEPVASATNGETNAKKKLIPAKPVSLQNNGQEGDEDGHAIVEETGLTFIEDD